MSLEGTEDDFNDEVDDEEDDDYTIDDGTGINF